MFPKYVLLSICAFIQSHFGRPGKFHSIHPSGVHTFFFPKTSYDQRIFFQRRVGSHLFSKACWFFQLDNLFFFFSPSFFFIIIICLFLFLVCSFFFFFFFFFHEVFCYLNMCIFLWGIFAIYMHIQGILPPKHTYICFVKYFFVYIHAHLRYLST